MMALLVAFAVSWDWPRIEALPAPIASHEVIEVLQQWEQTTAGTRRLEAKFDSYQYNDVFLTEKRGKGSLSYTAPDQGAFRIEPVDVARLRPRSKGWKLETGPKEVWEWSSTELTCAFDGGHKESHVRRPPSGDIWPTSFQQFIDTPGGNLRPFLANFRSTAARWCYRVRITSRDEKAIRLEFSPAGRS